MSMCEHETCPYCLRIVSPIVRESRSFITKTCPMCGKVISDIAKLDLFRRQARLAQEEQYLAQAFDAESRGNLDARNALLEWAKERREAASDE